MERIPDLVRDSRLETRFHSGYTIHLYYESGSTPYERAVPRREFWRREKHIGRGSYGDVWLERCVKGQKDLEVRAVKQISIGPRTLTHVNYNRELEAISKFSHRRYERCFVKSFGWYQGEKALSVTMEYLPEGDLHNYLISSPPVPELDVQHVTFQILEGVSFLHDNDFAHRDLKPSNILIKSKPPEQWWVKIGDFGISKRIEDQLPASSTLRGTLSYMAPELHGFTKPGSATSSRSHKEADIWSLGEITYQMLTKQPAFQNMGILYTYVQGSHPFPLEKLQSHNVSTSGQGFLSSTMQSAPNDRLTCSECLCHEWMKAFRAPSSRPASITSIGSLPPQESLPVAPDAILDEPSAIWSTLSSSEVQPDSLASINSSTEQVSSPLIPIERPFTSVHTLSTASSESSLSHKSPSGEHLELSGSSSRDASPANIKVKMHNDGGHVTLRRLTAEELAAQRHAFELRQIENSNGNRLLNDAADESDKSLHEGSLMTSPEKLDAKLEVDPVEHQPDKLTGRISKNDPVVSNGPNVCEERSLIKEEEALPDQNKSRQFVAEEGVLEVVPSSILDSQRVGTSIDKRESLRDLGTSVASNNGDSEDQAEVPIVHAQYPNPGKGGPLYGYALYDFNLEERYLLKANRGDGLRILAQSEPEWVLAENRPFIGSVGLSVEMGFPGSGPIGLIPVAFVSVIDRKTGKPAVDVVKYLFNADLPSVQEWQRVRAMAATIGRPQNPLRIRLNSYDETPDLEESKFPVVTKPSPATERGKTIQPIPTQALAEKEPTPDAGPGKRAKTETRPTLTKPDRPRTYGSTKEELPPGEPKDYPYEATSSLRDSATDMKKPNRITRFMAKLLPGES